MRARTFLKRLMLSATAALILLGATTALAAPRSVKLQLKWYHQFQFAGYYAAQTKGYYERAGLDVQIIEGSPNRPPISAVTNGQAEFGVHDGGDLLYARLRGEPVVALAVVFQHSPYVILSLKDNAIRTPSDLIGKVMMDESHGASPLLAMLRREGIEYGAKASPSAVQIIPHTWRLEDLLEGRAQAISAYLTEEPLRLRRRGIDVSLLRPVEYGIDFYGDTLFTSEQMLNDDPELVEAFRAASMRGWEYAMTHTQELVDEILSLPTGNANRMSRELLIEEAGVMQGIIMPTLVELGHMNPGRWERMAQEYVNLGVVRDVSRVSGFVRDPMAAERKRQALLKPLGYGLGLVLLLATASLVWVQQLRSKVKHRTAALEREVALREYKSRQLAAAEQKTRAILAALPDQVFVTRRDGTVVDYTRTAEDAPALESGRPEVPVADQLPTEVAEDIKGSFDAWPTERSTLVHEIPVEGSGDQRVLETRTVRLGDDQLVSVVRDVTDQKRAQERLALLAAAMEQAAEDIIITDANSLIQYVNPAFEVTTGYASDEVVGKPMSVLSSGKHDPAFYKELYSTLARGEVWSGRFTNRAKNGRLILQDATIVAIRDSEGRSRGYVSARRDVTRQVELETQVEQSQRMQAIGTLAGGIAHDFNNVLAAVIGYTGLALARKDNPAETVAYLKQVLRAAQRAAALTRQILAFSRGLPDDARPVQVQAQLEEALKLVRATIPSSIEVQLQSETQANVRVAPGDLERIIINLCSNASLAIGATPGQIRIGLEEVLLDGSSAELRGGLNPGRYVRLSVADDGCGMPSEVKQRLFEPFFTTRKSGEGTGLGLSVVHGIVRSHGGAVQVQSEPNHGARFDIWLPVVEPEHAEPDAQPLAPVLGTGQIMFVDDEEMLTSMFKRALELCGYRVETFNNSTDALQAFESRPESFDLVVTDLAMPKLRGDDLAARIKAIRKDVRVLLCTGNDAGLNPAVISPACVDQVLRKPLSIEQMASAVQSALQPPSG